MRISIIAITLIVFECLVYAINENLNINTSRPMSDSCIRFYLQEENASYDSAIIRIVNRRQKLFHNWKPLEYNDFEYCFEADSRDNDSVMVEFNSISKHLQKIHWIALTSKSKYVIPSTAFITFVYNNPGSGGDDIIISIKNQLD